MLWVKRKHVFVAWSGGLDSTYLIRELLDQGHRVSAGYIEITNNTTKTARELAAIEKLLKLDYLKGDFHYKGKIVGFGIEHYGGAICLSQPLIWLMGLAYSIDESEPYDEVALGYVMNDDAISYLDDIRKTYRGLQPMMRIKLPPLVFPLTRTKKNEMWEDLPYDVKDAVTWCEGPGVEDRCGECHACQRMKKSNLWLAYWERERDQAIEAEKLRWAEAEPVGEHQMELFDNDNVTEYPVPTSGKFWRA